jgi:hypothetical protein
MQIKLAAGRLALPNVLYASIQHDPLRQFGSVTGYIADQVLAAISPGNVTRECMFSGFAILE